MRQQSADSQSQRQDNLVQDTEVRGDLIFAPVEVGTKIETQIVQVSAAKVTQQPLIKSSPYQGLKRFNLTGYRYALRRTATGDRTTRS